MTEQRRKPIYSNVPVIAGLLLVIALLYMLSYPVAVRAGVPTDPAYRPIEWLIDHTPLRGPILAWMKMWGVRRDFVFWVEFNR